MFYNLFVLKYDVIFAGISGVPDQRSPASWLHCGRESVPEICQIRNTGGHKLHKLYCTNLNEVFYYLVSIWSTTGLSVS